MVAPCRISSVAFARWVALGAGLFVGLSARSAAAEPEFGFISLGYLASAVGGDNPAIGHGLEASGSIYLDENLLGLGPVLQYQNYSSFESQDSGPSHARLGIGGQIIYRFFGVELLYAHRQAKAGRFGTHGITLGPYASYWGVLHLAGRLTLPISPTAERGWGAEYGMSLGIKIPLPIDGEFGITHGRALRLNGQAVTAQLATDWTRTLELDPLSPSNDGLAHAWQEIASEEHASNAAFDQLLRSLLVVGAPEHLLRGTAQASRDEQRHAAFALAQAEHFAHRALQFCPLPMGLGSQVIRTFPELALESLVDGCLGEGAASRVFAEASTEANSPELAVQLAFIAEDEARHAELAWAVVEFCLEKHPTAVRDVLEEWMATATRVAPVLERRVPKGYGILLAAQQVAHAQGTWASVMLRLHALLKLDLLAA